MPREIGQERPAGGTTSESAGGSYACIKLRQMGDSGHHPAFKIPHHTFKFINFKDLTHFRTLIATPSHFGYERGMKCSLLGHFSFLVLLSAATSFASNEVDPRISSLLRAEQSKLQMYCFTFLQEGNGTNVADTCLHASAARYYSNLSLAAKDKNLVENETSVTFPRIAEYCAAVGKFTEPGSFVKSDCNAWNSARNKLFVLVATAPLSGRPKTAEIDAAISQASSSRRRFCQSLASAGNRGDPSIFASRISGCFTAASLATATDRAIGLGAY